MLIKLLQPFPLHPIDQQYFLTANQSYHSQVTPICTLNVEKKAEAVLLYASTSQSTSVTT